MLYQFLLPTGKNSHDRPAVLPCAMKTTSLFLSDTVARKDYLTVTLSFTFTSKVMLRTGLTSPLGLEKMVLLLQCASICSVIPLDQHFSPDVFVSVKQTGYFKADCNIWSKIFYYYCCKLKIKLTKHSFLFFFFFFFLVLRLHNEFLYVDWPLDQSVCFTSC